MLAKLGAKVSTKPPSATTSAKEKRKPLRQQSTGEKRYVDPFADEYAELLPRDAKQKKKQQQEGRGLHGYIGHSRTPGERGSGKSSRRLLCAAMRRRTIDVTLY